MEYYQLKAKAEMVDRMFKMGEQARQAEIDELQEKIDELVAYRNRFGNKGNRHEH